MAPIKRGSSTSLAYTVPGRRRGEPGGDEAAQVLTT